MLFLLRFTLYYTASVLSFAILSIPGVLFANYVVLRFLERYEYVRMLQPPDLPWLFVLLGVTGTVAALLWDTVTGSTIHSLLGDATEITSSHDQYQEEHTVFTSTASRFGLKNVRLYVIENELVNAYAIQTPARRVVALTTGLLQEFARLWNANAADGDRAAYLKAVEGIMGHELSHLKHTDSLPDWLFTGAFNSAQLLSRISVTLVHSFSAAFVVVPLVGPLMAGLSNLVVTVAIRSINLVNQWLVMSPVQKIDAFLIRVVEKRCDRESGEKTDPWSIFLGLFGLGITENPQGWNPLADHPPTISRVANAYRRSWNTDSSPNNRISSSLAIVNRYIAVGAVAIGIVFSAAFAMVAGERLDWIESPQRLPVWTIIDDQVNRFSHGVTTVLNRATTQSISVAELRAPIDQTWSAFNRIGQASLEFVGIGSEDRSQLLVFFSSLITSVAAVSIGRRIIRFLLPIINSVVMLPAFLVVRRAENRETDTPIDIFFFQAVDAKSTLGILSLMRGGANRHASIDGTTPFQYAHRTGRYYLLPYLK